MVDMRMGEAERADACGSEGKSAVIKFPLGFGPLEHAAIDQDADGFGFEQEARARYGLGGTIEMKA
jgi:hypothetical protein